MACFADRNGVSLLTAWLFITFSVAACHRPATSKRVTLVPSSSSSSAWRAAWAETALTKIETPTINVSGPPGSWQVEMRLHVDRAAGAAGAAGAAAKPYERVLLYQNDAKGVPYARLQRFVELPLLLRSSSDGMAIAFSADNGKRWRMLRFDLLTKENEPVYCPHYAFAGGGEIPPLEATVIDMFDPQHNTKHARQTPPGESQHVITEEENTDDLLGYECPLQPTGCNGAETEAATSFACGAKGSAIENVALAYARSFVSRRRGREDATCIASLATRWPSVKKELFDAPLLDDDQRVRVLDAREKLGKP